MKEFVVGPDHSPLLRDPQLNVLVGKRFQVDVLEVNDLKAEKVASSWMPGVRHPSISEEEFAAMTAKLTSGLVLAFSTGAWKVSDEWNSLLPDYRFTPVAEFLNDVWGNRS